MAARYGHSWVSQYGASPSGLAGAEWRDTLAGVSPEMLRNGFTADAARGEDWPPSSTKFRALCFDIQSQAVIEATWSGSGESNDSFVRLMWRFIDGWEYRNADMDKARLLRRNAYAAAREHILCGGECPGVPVARLSQEQPIRKPQPERTPEEIARIHAEAEAARAHLRSMFETPPRFLTEPHP